MLFALSSSFAFAGQAAPVSKVKTTPAAPGLYSTSPISALGQQEFACSKGNGTASPGKTSAKSCSNRKMNGAASAPQGASAPR
jgi:hypothetical protein